MGVSRQDDFSAKSEQVIASDDMDTELDYIIGELSGSNTDSLNDSNGMQFTHTPYVLDHTGCRLKVFNDSGGDFADKALVYVSGYDATNSVYEVTKAISAATSAATYYATLICDGSVTNGAVGYCAAILDITAVDTSAGSVGDPVYLSTTAGGWTLTLPVAENRIQVVGFIAVDSATVGRIHICLPGAIIPWMNADQI